MSLSSFLQPSAPISATEFATQAIQDRQKQALANTNIQSAQEELASKRRSLAVSMLNGISNEPDPDKQAELYATLKPMAERYDPTLKLPDAYDPSLGKALISSQIAPAQQADIARQNRALDLDQQRIDQGKYTPIKDAYGNPTGFMDTKTGEMKYLPSNGEFSPLPPVDTAGNPVTGDDYLKTLPPDHAAVVKAIGEGRMAPPSGYALTKPLGQKLMQDVGQAYPDYNANAYGALKEFNTGKLGNTVRSLNVANDHLDTLSQYATALQNGDTKALNALSNVFSTQFGQTAPTNFNAVKQVVGDEVVKAVLGGAGGLGDREEIKNNINAASSPEQLAGVIASYKRLMHGQLAGLKQQYETATGKSDFLSRLSPQTQKEIMTDGQQPAGAPKVGAVEDGYSYLGGDPADPKSWKAVP